MENQRIEAFIKKENLMRDITKRMEEKLILRSAVNADIKKLDNARELLINSPAENSLNLFSEFEDLDAYLRKDLKQ